MLPILISTLPYVLSLSLIACQPPFMIGLNYDPSNSTVIHCASPGVDSQASGCQAALSPRAIDNRYRVEADLWE
jgi:hypothetical protein